MHVTAIIAAAGAGRRLGAPVPKQLLDIGGRTILQRSVDAFASHPLVSELIVVLAPELVREPPAWLAPRPGVRLVAGGERRQDSVANACDALAEGTEVVLVHDAARPFVSSGLIARTIEAAARYGAAIPGLPVRDTVKRTRQLGADRVVADTVPREELVLAQTPQGFRPDVLRAAVALGRAGTEATDEAALAERAGRHVHVIEGEPLNVKITTPADLESARARTRDAASVPRTGIGYDLHRLVAGRRLVLGGVEIPADRGPLGHSDADVVCHAVTDAVLGAAGLGDIGRHFPDTDDAWRDASSVDLLRRSAALVRTAGYRVTNVDVVVVLERPKIAAHVEAIRDGVAAALGIVRGDVFVKGKTNEGVDAVGRGEAIAAHAVATLVATEDGGGGS